MQNNEELRTRPAQNWRELLSGIIEDHQEKQRLARELLLNPITLERWASRQTTPHQRNLRQLVQVLRPAHQASMVDLIQQEFPAFDGDASQVVVISAEEIPEELPTVFAMRVIGAYASIMPTIRYWTITNLIFQQLLTQLNIRSESVRHSIGVLKCTPPLSPDLPVQSCYLASFRAYDAITTVQADALPVYFFGLEFLSTYPLHPIVRDLATQSEEIFPVSAGMKSLAFFPLQRAGDLAGFLCVMRTKEFHQTTMNLLAYYANLLTLSFTDRQFYPLGRVVLEAFPMPAQQMSYQMANRSMRQRLRDLREQKGPLSQEELETAVLGELEAELASLPS